MAPSIWICAKYLAVTPMRSVYTCPVTLSDVKRLQLICWSVRLTCNMQCSVCLCVMQLLSWMTRLMSLPLQNSSTLTSTKDWRKVRNRSCLPPETCRHSRRKIKSSVSFHTRTRSHDPLLRNQCSGKQLPLLRPFFLSHSMERGVQLVFALSAGHSSQTHR